MENLHDIKRPVVTYACETWTLHRANNSLVFERQISRKIFGQIQCKEGWKVRSDNELQQLIKEKILVNI
jgi:hypothetical protein